MDDNNKCKLLGLFESIIVRMSLLFIFIIYIFFVYTIGVLSSIFVYDILLILFDELCFWAFSFFYLVFLTLIFIIVKKYFKRSISTAFFISVPMLISFSLCIFIFSIIYSKTTYFYKNNFKIISERNFPENGELINEKLTDFPSPDYSLSFGVKVSDEYFEKLLSDIRNDKRFKEYKANSNFFVNKKLGDANHIEFDFENKIIYFWRFAG